MWLAPEDETFRNSCASSDSARECACDREFQYVVSVMGYAGDTALQEYRSGLSVRQQV